MPDQSQLSWTGVASPQVTAPVYVYELPVRIWHWLVAAAITVLAITGWLIGNPPWPLFLGQPYNHYLMGDIRLAHFLSGYVLALGMMVRIYWTFVGNRYAREIFVPRVWTKDWWHAFFRTVRWYLLIERETGKETGHNPLAQLAMLFMFVVGVLFEIITGFALYGEGTGYGSWSNHLFTSWVIPLFGSSQTVHTWHHLAMWYLIMFVIVHVYMAIREDIMSRQTMISTMVDGWRYFKDGRP
ncbi:Ni/Fe-hydrogenase, b-type cytochrome subunit [Thiomonas sp. FB-Cd]|uniref:Ni/Fe-hydrogenase, b-type cytochrome subunit n=1 Tax=Thiomonas sp. FB-Cd TaxID=1158292 RepID=UPI0004DF596B|nr:Ni/Fe-hydrogenase, b-type cytochrome subunit [Thiomonas sp. FB-Cd]